MRNKFLRVVSLLLVLTLLLPAASCKKKQKDRKYDEATVLAAARALLPEAEKLNQIYYGKGFSTVGQAENGYTPASATSLAAYGVSSFADLKEKTEAVYSDAVVKQIASTKLSSVIDEDNTLVAYARYFERDDGVLMVRNDARVDYTDTLSLDLGAAYCDRAKGDVVYVYVPYVVTNASGDTQSGKLHLGFVEETDGWRLNTVSYTNYHNLDYKF
ncbi:MAG: hypothetical protein KBT31_02615 [Firmicutes bacterium]|nr:hypothetical protein [Candidatus Colimorpha enterica]